MEAKPYEQPNSSPFYCCWQEGSSKKKNLPTNLLADRATFKMLKRTLKYLSPKSRRNRNSTIVFMSYLFKAAIETSSFLAGFVAQWVKLSPPTSAFYLGASLSSQVLLLQSGSLLITAWETQLWAPVANTVDPNELPGFGRLQARVIAAIWEYSNGWNISFSPSTVILLEHSFPSKYFIFQYEYIVFQVLHLAAKGHFAEQKKS